MVFLKIKGGPSKKQLFHSMSYHGTNETSTVFFTTTDDIRIAGTITALEYTNELDSSSINFTIKTTDFAAKGHYNYKTYNGEIEMTPMELLKLLISQDLRWKNQK